MLFFLTKACCFQLSDMIIYIASGPFGLNTGSGPFFLGLRLLPSCTGSSDPWLDYLFRFSLLRVIVFLPLSLLFTIISGSL